VAAVLMLVLIEIEFVSILHARYHVDVKILRPMPLIS